MDSSLGCGVPVTSVLRKSVENGFGCGEPTVAKRSSDSPEYTLSVRKILEFGKTFLLAFIVSAVEQLPKIFSLREQHGFKFRFLRHWKENRARSAIFRNHDRRLRWQLFYNFAELRLNQLHEDFRSA
ncbi:MAG TPA: hypothetical protein VIB79_31590 [Candidatus Binatia bacterium]